MHGHIARGTIVVMLAMTAAAALADTRSWDGTGNGIDWYDPANWSPDGGPAASDALTVTAADPTATADVFVSDGGSVTVTAAGAAATFADLCVGGTGVGTFALTDFATLRDGNTFVGYLGGSQGTLTVAQDANWIGTGPLYLGVLGQGTLHVTDRGAVTHSETYLALAPSADANALVRGSGSTLRSTWGMVVGVDGPAVLTVDQGASVQGGFDTVGMDGNAVGTVRVHGDNTAYDAPWGLVVGDAGDGTVSVQAGARLYTGYAAIGAQAGSQGSLTIEGAAPDGTATQWACGSSVYVGGGETGPGGTGSLTIRDGATADIAWDLRVWDGGSLTIADANVTTRSLLLSSGAAFSFDSGHLRVAGGDIDCDGGDFVIDGPGAPRLDVAWLANARLDGNCRIGGTHTGEVRVSQHSTFGTDGTLHVAGSGTLSVTDGTLVAGTLQIDPGASVSAQPQSVLRVNALAGEALSLAWPGSLEIGHAGSLGLLGPIAFTVDPTIPLTVARDLRVGVDTPTGVLLDGGAQVSVGGDLYGGYNGSGRVDVSGNGRVTCRSAFLGYSPGSVGDGNVDGAGASWTATDSIFVGGTATVAGGAGTLRLANGGTVVAPTAVRVYAGSQLRTGEARIECGTLDLRGHWVVEGSGQTTRVTGGLKVVWGATLDLSGSRVVFEDPVNGAGLWSVITSWIASGRITGDLTGNRTVVGAYYPFDSEVRLACTWRGDTDCDLDVDLDDLTILGTFYGASSGMGWEHGDFTGDGAVDLDDLTLLGTFYGATPTAPQPVPEPATGGLLLVLVALGLRRRRATSTVGPAAH